MGLITLKSQSYLGGGEALFTYFYKKKHGMTNIEKEDEKKTKYMLK
jgi:hypothetical protein